MRTVRQIPPATPSGFDFLFRTRPRALWQQTPPEPVLILQTTHPHIARFFTWSLIAQSVSLSAKGCLRRLVRILFSSQKDSIHPSDSKSLPCAVHNQNYICMCVWEHVSMHWLHYKGQWANCFIIWSVVSIFKSLNLRKIVCHHKHASHLAMSHLRICETRTTFETPKYPRRLRAQYTAQIVNTLELSAPPPNRGKKNPTKQTKNKTSSTL